MSKNKYRNTAKDEALEEEIKELEKQFYKPEENEEEDDTEVVKVNEPEQLIETPTPVNTSAEEESFKKRYGDLRAHSQKMENEFKTKIAELERQLAETIKQPLKYPTKEEDLESWMQKYPDVAAIIETIALKKVEERQVEVKKRFEELDREKAELTKAKAKQKLLELHPDLEDIAKSEDFRVWIKQRSQEWQDALFKNSTDPFKAAEVLDFYKAQRKIKTAKTDTSATRDAAQNVKSGGATPPENPTRLKYTESKVAAMNWREYGKHEAEINEAMKSPEFWDISGGAR